jgi:sortase (surface protein transpeptidase)
MHVRKGFASRLQPSRLLLVSVMSVAIVVVPSSFGNGIDAPRTLHSEPASESPVVPRPTPLLPVTAPPRPTPPPQSTPGADRSATPPSEQTTADAEPTQPAVAGTMTAATPVRLQIPSIGVDSELMDLGLQADGTLQVPPGGFPAGWYTGAPTPGELGPAIIAGHVDWGGQPGVFFDLRELSTGDEIAITRDDGSTARFRVTHVEQFAKDAFPTQAVYGNLDHAGLRLITCGGSFDPQMRSYNDNLVVFAELIGS